MKKIFILYFIISATISLSAQVEIEWQRCFGGTSGDYAQSIRQTSDGGYVVAGYTWSNNGDVSGNHGNFDYWVVKLDSAGNLLWQKCLGGSGTDDAYSIQQTSDGGYVVAGSTSSLDGDVSGSHGLLDYWVGKLDAAGNLQWQKCLGGTGTDWAYSIHQTSDGGYVVAGYTWSTDGDVSGNHGYCDYWVVKLDTAGNLQWQKCLGGTLQDFAQSIQQTSDGGFVVAGETTSADGDVSGNNGGYDYWVVKLDTSGIIQWQKCLGGTLGDSAFSIQQTNDGGYVIVGNTFSNDDDVSSHHNTNFYDVWVVKLDPNGSIQWQKCIGGTDDDRAYSIQQTSEGGYIVAGYTWSIDGDISENHGSIDYWVVKLDALGDLQWQKCLGGTQADKALSVQQTSDGGYVVAGESNSANGDVSGNHGYGDYWVVKFNFTAHTPLLEEPGFVMYPNPSSHYIYINLLEFTRKVEVYNINGELVQQQVPQKQVAEINIKELPKGVYVVKMYSGKGVVTTRFVKE